MLNKYRMKGRRKGNTLKGRNGLSGKRAQRGRGDVRDYELSGTNLMRAPFNRYNRKMGWVTVA